MPPELYSTLGYYERWICATEISLVEKGILTREEIAGRTEELEKLDQESWGEG